MTDDEIDAVIRAVVPAECFVPNAGARAIFRAGMRRAAEIARSEGRVVSTYYRAYTRGCYSCAGIIERAAGGEG